MKILEQLYTQKQNYDIIFSWKQPISVKAGTSESTATPLVTYSYSNDGKRYLTEEDYANGQSITYENTTDSGLDAKKIMYKQGGTVSNTAELIYDELGNVYKKVTDSNNYSIYKDGNTTDYQEKGCNINAHTYSSSSYDNGTQTEEFFVYLDKRFVNSYTSNEAENYSWSSQCVDKNTTPSAGEKKQNDAFDRLSATSVYAGGAASTPIITQNYTYVSPSDGTTSHYVDTQNISAKNYSKAYKYTYDGNGAITSIKDGTTPIASYEYDEGGQLIRANDALQNKSFTYRYDEAGNIQAKTEYAYTAGTLGAAIKTVNYAYGDSNWKDKLTSYDGKAVTYDASGNPLTYDGWTYTWQRGRQLGKASNGSDNISYSYNDDGLRTEKKVNGTETDYTWADGKLTSQRGGSALYFFYDSDNSPVSVNYNGANYFYVKNIQGDITAITDASGAVVVEYSYDTWGKLLSTTGSLASTLGKDNPLRYRGYYYDNETGLYYLQSRYYNPEWGRFLNADDTQHLDGMSLFGYCSNNPVMNIDPTGKYGINDQELVFFTILCIIAVAYYAYLPLCGEHIRSDYEIKKDINYGYSMTRDDRIINIVLEPMLYPIFEKLCENEKNSYNLFSAIKYARRWAYAYNDNYKSDKDGDCANFVSQCIHAAGIDMTGEWYNKKVKLIGPIGYYKISNAWGTVKGLKAWLEKYHIVGRKKNRGYKSMNQLRQAVLNGDVMVGDIGFCDWHYKDNPKTKVDESKEGFGHAVLITSIDIRNGVAYYSAHTNPQCDTSCRKLFEDDNGTQSPEVVTYNIK